MQAPALQGHELAGHRLAGQGMPKSAWPGASLYLANILDRAQRRRWVFTILEPAVDLSTPAGSTFAASWPW